MLTLLVTPAETVSLVVASGGTDDVPEAEDVTAGTWGLVVFVLLVLATIVLMRSFLKQMRKADQARREGVFGDKPTSSSPEGDDDVR